MKIKDLKRILESDYLDDDADVMMQGVRNGKIHCGYESWTTKDGKGRDTIGLSIATEGDGDYAVIIRERDNEDVN